MFMAINTTKHSKIPGSSMAIIAIIPFSVMCAAVDREIHIVVIKRGWCPCVLAMTGFAGERESRTLVVRVVGAVVILRMTSITGIWCIVVITPNMTRYTIIGNSSMRSDKWIKIIVVECRRNPCIF